MSAFLYNSCLILFLFLYIAVPKFGFITKSRITLDYKSLFQQIIALLSTPGKAWSEIAERGVGRSVMPAFVYPLIGLCGLSEFIGTFIGKDFSSVMFQVALTRCCAVAVALFGGFFLSAYLLDKLNHNWLGGERILYDRILVFVGYSMVVTFCIEYRQWTVFYSCTALDIANIYHCNCIRGGTQMDLRLRRTNRLPLLLWLLSSFWCVLLLSNLYLISYQ